MSILAFAFYYIGFLFGTSLQHWLSVTDLFKLSEKEADECLLALVKEIDWKAHADSLDTIGSMALRRIIWNKHPTHSRMRMMKNHPSGRCPLCGEMDYNRHPLECQVVSDTDKYADLVEEKEHEAEKFSIPDHLMSFIKVLMKEQRYSVRRVKAEYRGP